MLPRFSDTTLVIYNSRNYSRGIAASVHIVQILSTTVEIVLGVQPSNENLLTLLIYNSRNCSRGIAIKVLIGVHAIYNSRNCSRGYSHPHADKLVPIYNSRNCSRGIAAIRDGLASWNLQQQKLFSGYSQFQLSSCPRIYNSRNCSRGIAPFSAFILLLGYTPFFYFVASPQHINFVIPHS